ncbi:solute carrier organic anion transporter family member 4A1 [Homalodisca vitripennis]|nr:solute carrier organic anion transporter family member 4A1 [Homalodisca vitripennis]
MYTGIINSTQGGEESVHLLWNTDESTVMEETEENAIDYKCGWLMIKPNWMQSFRTPAWALTFISCSAFLQGAIVNGVLHLMIPTIEQRFNLPSFKSGLVSGGYDIASLICLIPVTYIGGRPKACKPTWIGVGILVMGVGSLIFASPHFMKHTPFTVTDSSDTTLCRGSHAKDICQGVKESKLSIFMWVFFVGNLFHGAGASPLYTLGVTYIDESVVKKKTGIYIGLYYTAATVGVAVGYIVGGFFLQLHEDFPTGGHAQHLSPYSKTWIGAWWLGFVILGLLCLVIAMPILALPTQLPDWEQVRLSKVSEAVIGVSRTKAYTGLKDFPAAILELLKNTSFMLLNFAGCCEGVVFSGSGAFIPKIIQSQFHLSYKTTALVMGIITVPSAVLGTMVGGGILKKFDLRFVGILKLCIGTTTLAMICASCFLITCSQEKMIGLNVPYYEDRKEIKLDDPCNDNCGCSWEEYLPVCGTNNYTYFSACYAGCTTAHKSDFADVTLYSNCSCIEEIGDNGVQASSQPCKMACSLLPLFLIMLYLSLFFTFVAVMPALTATLRCVKSDQRSLALGMQWMLVRLLGMIPGPMLFGVILDGTCEYWHAPCSKEEGSCILYDHYSISRTMVLLAFGWKSLEVVLFALSIYFYKKDTVNSSIST